MICFTECNLAIYDVKRNLREDLYTAGRSGVIYDHRGRCATAIHHEDYGMEYFKTEKIEDIPRLQRLPEINS